MSFVLFFYGILIGLFVTAPLGPVGVMCIQRTINRGLKSGLITGIGAASADTLYSIIAGLGVGYLVTFIEEKKYWIQLIGAAIIILIAIKIFYTNPAIAVRNGRNKKNKPLEDFLSSFIVTLTNPTVLIVFLAAFARFGMVDENTDYFSASILIGGIFAGAFGWWYVLCNLINKFRNKIRLKNIWWLNKIMGVIVFILGVIALVELFL